MIDGESLLNDGSAMVMFLIFLGKGFDQVMKRPGRVLQLTLHCRRNVSLTSRRHFDQFNVLSHLSVSSQPSVTILTNLQRIHPTKNTY